MCKHVDLVSGELAINAARPPPEQAEAVDGAELYQPGLWFNVETAFGVKEPGVETGREVMVHRC